MARRISSIATITPTATADTVALSNGTYPFCFQGGSGTQLTNFWEISISGQAASSSSPSFMLFSYDSTVGTGTQTYGTAGSDVAINAATVALAAPVGVGNVFVTVQPQRWVSGHLLNCSLNAFGGVYFWRANRVEECPTMLGNTANLGSTSLSAFTGGTTGAMGAHVIYESL